MVTYKDETSISDSQMPNKYLNEQAVEILEANKSPGQTPSGVIVELARKAGAKIPKEVAPSE